MHIIDYEYACPNYAMYDVGNHFNEFAGEWSHILFFAYLKYIEISNDPVHNLEGYGLIWVFGVFSCIQISTALNA